MLTLMLTHDIARRQSVKPLPESLHQVYRRYVLLVPCWPIVCLLDLFESGFCIGTNPMMYHSFLALLYLSVKAGNMYIDCISLDKSVF